MEFIRINSKDDKYFNDAIKIYETSFPIFEQRTIKNQIEVLEDKDYHSTIICENNSLIGLLFYWKYGKYTYIEHLAISPNLRGKNYGSKILKTFCEDNKYTILEIDNPIDEISIKRLKFYSKIGFKLQNFEHIHPPYRNGYEGHNLKIMSFNRDLSKEEYDEFNVFLKTKVMKYSEKK
ncbi:MAG: GNAT family N-acetyltransferase [Clostridium perfringens]|nr:GNAT family N-acetyltransferase [Clostridium perfringens]